MKAISRYGPSAGSVVDVDVAEVLGVSADVVVVSGSTVVVGASVEVEPHAATTNANAPASAIGLIRLLSQVSSHSQRRG
jgi:hypothetical protein